MAAVATSRSLSTPRRIQPVAELWSQHLPAPSNRNRKVPTLPEAILIPVILSMTFCTDPRTSPLKGTPRRVKDTAYYGVRALWT